MSKLAFSIGLCILAAITGSSAQMTIDTSMVSQAAALIDLRFSAAKEDSMLDGLENNREIIKKMHQTDLVNSQPFPIAFLPTVPGLKIPTNQKPVQWKLPEAVAMPAHQHELAFFSILDLAALLREKKISSVALTRFFLDRLHKWSDSLHCAISFTDSIAYAQARQADDDFKKGIDRGLLQGIPYGLKDLFSVKNTLTTWGARAYKDQQLEQDAFVYQQLKKAGAVLCAKLSLGALAMDDVWFGGRTRNPWNTATGSSGSSAGSASATAAGLLPFAIGTETWGSIISPSHVCGVTGLRPTFGSVSRSGTMALAYSLDKIGPLCHSAEDAAIVFSYIKGTDGLDPSAQPRAFNYTGKADLKHLRIAYAVNYFDKLPDSSAEWKAIKAITAMGITLKPIQFPDSTIYPVSIMEPIIDAECAAFFDGFTRNGKEDLMNGQSKGDWPNIFRFSRFIPAAEYLNAQRMRFILIEKFYDFIKQYDVVIVPSFSGNQLAITNLTGNPVLCIPVGQGPNGLPTSISLIGNLYDEATILALANIFQHATPFARMHPPGPWSADQ